MVRAVRGEEPEVCPVHAHTVQVLEVGIAWLPSRSGEVERAALLVDPPQLQHVPVAAGDPALEPAGPQVVEVEVPPVVALGKPDHLVRRGQHVPVDHAEPGLEEGLDRLLHYVANDARLRICHT